jgi:hypothetical protein
LPQVVTGKENVVLNSGRTGLERPLIGGSRKKERLDVIIIIKIMMMMMLLMVMITMIMIENNGIIIKIKMTEWKGQNLS